MTIEFMLNATIMVVALVMAHALWRSRDDRLRGIDPAMNLAFYGALCIASAKVINLVSVVATSREIVGPDMIRYLGHGESAIAVLGISLFAISLLSWIDAGKQLSSKAETAVEHRDILEAGFADRGLALSTVPAILTRRDAPLYDKNVTSEFLNDKVEEILGYSREELESDPYFLIWLMHPEDRQRFCSGEDRLATDQPRTVLEHRFKHRNGDYRWIRRYFTRIEDEHGNFKELIGCAFDITDLKDAEARLLNFLDSSPDAVITTNEEGLIELASARAVQIFGYPKEELQGLHVGALVSDEHRKRHLDRFPEVLIMPEDSGIDCAGEIRGLRKDGTTFPMEVNMSRIDGGAHRLVAFAVRDISDRMETEEKLRQAQKMEAVGQLTGGIAHDFNNMLTVIIGNLQMIKPTDIAEPSQQYVDAAINAAERASNLTNRLSAFSRRQVPTPKVIRINDLITAMECLLHRALGEDISLKTALTDELWPVRVDPGQFENALVNLAINARDAIGSGGELVIETANAVLDEDHATEFDRAPAGDYVQVTISDNGAGIEKDVLQHIFEPFFTTKEIGKGSGLGLSMVYGFIKQSRSHISVRSEEGCGTTITLYLPRSSSDQNGIAVAPRTSRVSAPSGNERILIVEDNDAVRDIVSDILTSLNYQVLQANSGSSALALLDRDSDIDLLFTDLIMPGGMTGAELAEKMRQRDPGLRVLYTSGHSDATASENKLLPSDASFLNKPYQKNALAKTVREVLDRV